MKLNVTYKQLTIILGVIVALVIVVSLLVKSPSVPSTDYIVSEISFNAANVIKNLVQSVSVSIL